MQYHIYLQTTTYDPTLFQRDLAQLNMSTANQTEWTATYGRDSIRSYVYDGKTTTRGNGEDATVFVSRVIFDLLESIPVWQIFKTFRDVKVGAGQDTSDWEATVWNAGEGFKCPQKDTLQDTIKAAQEEKLVQWVQKGLVTEEEVLKATQRHGKYYM